jgi:hypothetical protein
MLKTTLYLDDFLQAQVKRVALRDNKSQAAIIRDALMKVFGGQPTPSTPPVRHRASVGAFNSGDPDFSQDVRQKIRADAASGRWKP